MEQFDALHRSLYRKNDLTVSAITFSAVTCQKSFTVTHAENKITVEYVPPDYISFYAEDGTPNDTFRVDQLTGEIATFFSDMTKMSFASASHLADHIADVLKTLSDNQPEHNPQGV